jgi:hypothetical protein
MIYAVHRKHTLMQRCRNAVTFFRCALLFLNHADPLTEYDARTKWLSVRFSVKQRALLHRARVMVNDK